MSSCCFFSFIFRQSATERSPVSKPGHHFVLTGTGSGLRLSVTSSSAGSGVVVSDCRIPSTKEAHFAVTSQDGATGNRNSQVGDTATGSENRRLRGSRNGRGPNGLGQLQLQQLRLPGKGKAEHNSTASRNTVNVES